MMLKEEFQFFVTRHKTIKNEDGTVYKMELKTGSKHKLVFQADSSDLFEGYPIGQAVTVKLENPQMTLDEAREE